jgi:flagellar hook-associated protein FlgK
MPDLSIALNGLNVALTAIDTVGNNIANAATDGFHRQEIAVEAIPYGGSARANVGGGSRVTEILRRIDVVVENEILRQQPLLAQVSQELGTLQTVESNLGDMGTQGLDASLDSFFGALQELAGQPDSAILRDQVRGAAESVTARLHDAAGVLDSLASNLRVEAGTLVDQLNSLATEVANLNGQLAILHLQGSANNNLADRRDETVKKMTELLNFQVQRNGDGTISLMAGGTPIVVGNQATKLNVARDAGGMLGLSPAGTSNFTLDVSGGKIGGVLALENDLLPGVSDELDALAREIIQQINAVHVQGVGTDGSFDTLDSRHVDEDLTTWQPPVAAGTVYVRVTDTATGEATRHAVAIDPATDSLSDVAAAFAAVPGLSAAVTGGRLHLEAESGYKFDFVPALLPQPSTSTLTGTAEAAISGAYTGTENQTLTCRVVGSGNVGVTGGLTIEVVDGKGNTVTKLKVGLGYRAGDALTVSDGVQVTLSAGTLNDGETFTIDVLASSDTSGFLAAAGLNTFFVGNSAATIDLAADVRRSAGRLATSRNAGGTDNANVCRMADVGAAPIAALGGISIGDYHRRMIAEVGQQVAMRQGRQEGLQRVVTQLENQRESLSGVDLNEEAAKLMLFEQLFQTMAKYLASVDKMQQDLFAVI